MNRKLAGSTLIHTVRTQRSFPSGKAMEHSMVTIRPWVAQVKTSASTVMGQHLLDALTMPQFADVISYPHSLK